MADTQYVIRVVDNEDEHDVRFFGPYPADPQEIAERVERQSGDRYSCYVERVESPEASVEDILYPVVTCTECGARLEEDSQGWFSPDDLDGTPDGRNDGRYCPDGEFHTVSA